MTVLHLLWQLKRPRLAAHARSRRRVQARQVVVSFLALVLMVNVVLSVGMDLFWPSLRDVEYTCRRDRLHARVAADPGRPLAVALGSSRSDFGYRPLAVDSETLVCNVSQVGAGPLIQLLTLRRLLHDGVRPQELFVEFWPPFLSGGSRSELGRIDPHRLFPSDEPFVREYLPDPEATLALMREIRRTPVWNHRQRIVSQTLSTWLPLERRIDGSRSRVDAAGWLPGPAMPQDLPTALKKSAEYYQPLFAEYALDPAAERALREILATARSRSIRITLVWLPESSNFRSWYPPPVVQQAEAFMASLAGEGVKLINARDWLADDVFPDGYHLTPEGAKAFTTRLLNR